MVADPRDYSWSSHHALAFGEPDSLLTPHRSYRALAVEDATRQASYRAMVMETIDPDALAAIRMHLQRQHPYGSARFSEAIQAQLGRAVGLQRVGRSRNTERIKLESRL